VDAFGFSTDIKVRFAETDAQGVVHHAAYLVWFEVARIEYLARFGGGYPGLQREGYEALTTDAHVHYRRAARFGDEVRIHTRCVGVGRSRFRFEYAVERAGELVAEGSTGHACVDAGTLRPTRLPAWLTGAIAAAEARAGAEA
jgi:acyl-CoA thioester hydrolase